jgi:hypothetical protein
MFELFKRAEDEKVELFHRSSWSALADGQVGSEFVLHPGMQGAEGAGVYFSEGVPPPASTAEGVARAGGQSAIVCIEVDSPAGWWRTKSALYKKFGRPRTWHSSGKSIHLTIRRRSEESGELYLYCDWSWA